MSKKVYVVFEREAEILIISLKYFEYHYIILSYPVHSMITSFPNIIVMETFLYIVMETFPNIIMDIPNIIVMKHSNIIVMETFNSRFALEHRYALHVRTPHRLHSPQCP